MKSVVADRETRIFALRIVARDSTTVRFVGYPHDLMIGANLYSCGAGYEFTGYTATSSMSPSVIDLEGILATAGISRDQVASGAWDNAAVYLFATSWAAPVEDEEPIAKFTLGKTHLRDDRFACEIMHIVDKLNQEVGRTISPTCGHTFGVGQCPVNLATYTVTGTITSVTDAGHFADSAIAAAAATYDGGTILFTSGNNVGQRALEIKTHSTGGSLQLFLPFHYLPQVGDAYTLTRGCPKTRDACKTYGAILDFGGFPDQPTTNMTNKVGGQ